MFSEGRRRKVCPVQKIVGRLAKGITSGSHTQSEALTEWKVLSQGPKLFYE